MTFPAINLTVFALQGIAREIVVEGLLVEAHHIELSPVVITVALKTVLILHT